MYFSQAFLHRLMTRDAFQRRNRLIRMRNRDLMHRMAGQTGLMNIDVTLCYEPRRRRVRNHLFMRVASMTNRTRIPFIQRQVARHAVKVRSPLEAGRVSHRLNRTVAGLAEILRMTNFAGGWIIPSKEPMRLRPERRRVALGPVHFMAGFAVARGLVAARA